jgi:hypothetical protein
VDTLFDEACLERTLARIRALRPDSVRAWGRMDVAQMMAHCALGIEAATGDAVLHRPLFGKFLGRFFKGWLLGPKPFSKNSPTHPLLTMKTPHDFAREHARLQAAVRRFHDLGPDSAARFEHAFVGRLTGPEWGILQAKHLDHHLRQFGG